MPVVTFKGKQNNDVHIIQNKDEKPGNFIAILPAETSNSSVALTEDDIAEDFAKEYADQLRYDHGAGRWYEWSTHWSWDKTRRAFDYARRRCRQLRKGDRRMASKKAAEGVEVMARSDQRLAVTSEIWDSNPFKLGTPSGTVDLTTGKLQPANQSDYITKLVAVAPAAQDVDCPL
jgi:putative DNA primase/helicase